MIPATIKLGSRSGDVARWQTIVGLPATGEFDAATAAATRAWQSARGLTPDGKVGPMTWTMALATEPVPRRPIGIDLSSWQTDKIAWRIALEAGPDFIIYKATDGTKVESKTWRKQLLGSLTSGVDLMMIPPQGVYAYNQFESAPGVSVLEDARLEAKFLLDTTGDFGRDPGELPPMLDAEDLTGHTRTSDEVRDWLLAAAEYIEKRIGRPPSIYSGKGFWLRFPSLAKCTELARCPLVTAEYRRKVDPQKDTPSVYAPWKQATIWQFAGDPKANDLASWPGVPGSCDRNVFLGTMNELRAMALLDPLPAELGA